MCYHQAVVTIGNSFELEPAIIARHAKVTNEESFLSSTVMVAAATGCLLIVSKASPFTTTRSFAPVKQW
jgi:hypothetical protein